MPPRSPGTTALQARPGALIESKHSTTGPCTAMTPNVGSADRQLRVTLAVTIAILGAVFAAGLTQLFLLAAAALLATSAAYRFCPLYRVFGTSTFPLNRRAV